MNDSIIKLIKLPVISDDCKLAVAENSKLPFEIKRVYYIYGNENNLSRGFHAHKENQQILFCLRGSVRMIIESAEGKSECTLANPSEGIFLDQMVWHEMHDIDESTILLVIASHEYDELDYIRDHQVSIDLIKK